LVTTHSVDVGKTRSFGYERYLKKHIPFAVGLLVLGVVLLVLTASKDYSDRRGVIGGIGLVLGSLCFIAYALHRQSVPGRPIVELSPAGILYRLMGLREVLIPWPEILGVSSVDIWRRVRFRDVTVVLVSRAFFDATFGATSYLKRGPGWGYYFIAKGDVVQIAFHHELLTIPADELRAEVEERWRAFSGHPDAALRPQVSSSRRSVRLFAGWRPPVAVKRIAVAALITAAVPALYFWRWPMAWLTFPDFPDTVESHYLGEQLDRAGVRARLADGRMTTLGRLTVSHVGSTSCTREIVRDEKADGWFPVYVASAYCTSDLKDLSGTPAVGIFKLVSKTFSYGDWQGKPQPYKAIVSLSLDMDEADIKLCELGVCAGAASPARR